MKNSFTLKSNKSKSLKGILSVPGDKSISIRSLLISSICFGNSKIFNILKSDDIFSTLKSLKQLGIKILEEKKYIEVFGQGGLFKNPKKEINLGNSGTGIRLLSGLISSRQITASLIGDDSLSKRPMMRIIEPLLLMNSKIEHNNGKLPLKIKNNNGRSIPIKYILKIGSAQVKSAILLASLNIKGQTKIIEKKPSRNHTEIMLKYFGAQIKIKKNEIILNSPNFLKPKDIYVPGDFSSAAFLIVAVLITKNSRITINNVGLNFYRTGLLDVLIKMGAKIKIINKKNINGEIVGDIFVESSTLKSIKLSEEIAPRLIDEYPILFVAASFASGISSFKGLKELKFKESNRLIEMADSLKNSGVDLEVEENSLKIRGKIKNKGGAFINTKQDHRVAMSMLIFGLASEDPITIDDPKMIKTSFPNFLETLQKIKAKIDYIPK